MESNEVKNAISGVLVVDKPVGMTSHDVVQAIRTGTGLAPRGPHRHAGSARLGRSGHSRGSGGAFERVRLRLRQALPGDHPPRIDDRYI